MHACMHAYTHAYMPTCLYELMTTFTHACVHMYVYTYHTWNLSTLHHQPSVSGQRNESNHVFKGAPSVSALRGAFSTIKLLRYLRKEALQSPFASSLRPASEAAHLAGKGAESEGSGCFQTHRNPVGPLPGTPQPLAIQRHKNCRRCIKQAGPLGVHT